MEDQKEPIHNPIDADKVALNPGLLPYAHTVGSAVVRPTKEGVIRAKAVQAMEEQTQMQLEQIRRQIDLLAQQAREIMERREISIKIYEASMRFSPVIGHTYYLYRKREEDYVLSMISPEEWGKSMPYEGFEATVKLLADHTWQKIA